MKWEYMLQLFLETHCPARGLRLLTIRAYRGALHMFRAYVQVRLNDTAPDQITVMNVLEYVEYLRHERHNGNAAINRVVTILRTFYRAMVAMGHLEYRCNPMTAFPKVKAPSRKVARAISTEEVARLIAAPDQESVLGIRDHALITLLYGTGIRVSECAGMNEEDVDFEEKTVRVVGKGGHERVVPLNDAVVFSLQRYRCARGNVKRDEGFFRSRNGRRMSRNGIYDRVKRYGRKARIAKSVSPHTLRHSFATHLVKAGVDMLTLRDLLGHRLITSTQIYLHTTAQDLREAAELHPVGKLIAGIADYLPDIRLPLPFQRPTLRASG